MPKTNLTPKKKTKYSAQQYLDIEEIRDGVVILRDGSFRAVLMASSLNFALKSEQEQDAIIFGYQDFINSISFPVQVLVTSRQIDIKPYLKELDAKEEEQNSELMKIQLQEYKEYIKELVKVSNVMTKNFYIVIPFGVAQTEEEGAFTKFFKGLKIRGGLSGINDTEFERYKDQLWQRVDQVAGNLRNLGVRLVPMNTQEIIELFYTLYNPDVSRNQRLPNIEELDIEDTKPETIIETTTNSDPENMKVFTKQAPDIEEAQRLYQQHQSRDV
jgi:hypothetical protein